MEQCKKCNKPFDKYKKSLCESCYDERYQLQLLKGRCLEIAGNVFANSDRNPDDPSLSEKIFQLTKSLYKEAKKQKYLEFEEMVETNLTPR